MRKGRMQVARIINISMKRFLQYLTEAKQISTQKFENFLNSKREEIYKRFINDGSSYFDVQEFHPEDHENYFLNHFVYSDKTPYKLNDKQREANDYLKQKLKENPNFHFENASKRMQDLINKADPTPNKEYGSWLVKHYTTEDNEPGAMGVRSYHIDRAEDFQEFHEPLETFHKNKQRKGYLEKLGYSNDIHSYTPDQFLKMHEDVKEKEPNPFPKTGFTTIHSDENLDIHRIDSKAGACYWGHGTRWCTRHEPKVGKYFKNEEDIAKDPYISYTHDPYHLPDHLHDHMNTNITWGDFSGPAHPLFIVHNKKTGEKFQYHKNADQFMDKNDMPVPLHQEVSFENYTKILKAHPDISHEEIATGKHDYLSRQAEIESRELKQKNNDNHNEFIVKREKELYNKYLTDEDVSAMIKTANPLVQINLIQRYRPKTNNSVLNQYRKKSPEYARMADEE